MVPWAGRLDAGLLQFDGMAHRFPLDMGPHAIHGTGYTSVWKERGRDCFEHHLVEPWPFGGKVTHQLHFGTDRIRLELTITAGTKAMPAQLGWHPWFRRSVGIGGSLEVAVSPSKMYELDSKRIPNGKLIAPKALPWDDCFLGLAMPPRLGWPDFATIELKSSCDHWVIFDHDPNAICVEPQSGPPNQLNHSPTVLLPGEELRGWFEIVVVD